MSDANGHQARLTPMARAKAILGGSAGNLVEWYDWFAYSSMALYFAKIFFPEGDQTAQLLMTAGVFAVGFFARPVGAWLMGLYADRAGRRAALTLSVGLMCLGSLIIAVAPGHAQIGPAAAWLLLGARILQGLSVGGEYGAAATYLSEMAGKSRRGFWSSFHYVTLIMGQLLALGVLIALQTFMDKSDLEAWGWRIPFVIGGVLAVVVFWIRADLQESIGFKPGEGKARSTTGIVFLKHPTESMMIMALTAGGSLAFYAYTTYMQKFLVNTSGFTRDAATMISAAALFCFMAAQPLFGWISDHLGRRRLMTFAFGVGAIAAVPLFATIATTTSAMAAFGLVLAALLIQSGYTSISAVIKAELFPAHVRALGVALPYALANALFGGTAEYVALWFKQAGFEQGFYWYVSAMCAISFFVALRMRDTAVESAILED